MLKAPQNNQLVPPHHRRVTQATESPGTHIIPVGPHEHKWQRVGSDGGEDYYVCKVCNTRRVGSYACVGLARQDFVDGADWERGGEGESHREGGEGREGRAFNPYRRSGRPRKNHTEPELPELEDEEAAEEPAVEEPAPEPPAISLIQR
jgi:hypothetical protein